MEDSFANTLYFRSCRTLEGQLEPVDLARRNGRLTPRFPPSCTEPNLDSKNVSDLKRLLREVMYSLSRIERRTWLLLLLGYSILDIAEHEKVTRVAIYERIRGNSKGQGGMIRKNDYVAIWWRRRGQELKP